MVAIGLATALAALPAPGQPWTLADAGKGGLILWPLFGATNQLLGGLAFLVIAFYLWRRRMPVWFLALPMAFMLVMPMSAMIWTAFLGDETVPSWASQGSWLLVLIGTATIALEIWMIVEALLLFPKARGVLEQGGEPAPDHEGGVAGVHC
jgi:carbon starvation protein